MTTHNDQSTPVDPMEARLRAMLTERSTDVETTPALFEDVRTRARRGTMVRRATGAVAVAAALTGGALALPGLLAEPQIAPIAPAPATAGPTEEPTAAQGGDARPAFEDLDISAAVTTTDGLFVNGREALSEQATIRSLGGYGVVQERVYLLAMVSEHEDGRVLVSMVNTTPDESGLGLVQGLGSGNEVVEATPNGFGVTMSPDGQAAAWIEGSELHIWPVGGGGEDSIRVLPLEGASTPGDLVIEQWFAYADAPVILASQPGGGMWTIPMEESNVYNTAPVGETFPSGMVADAHDAALLADGSTVAVHLASGSEPATVRLGDGPPFALPEPYASSSDLELEVGAGGGMTLLDRTGGEAMVMRFEGDDSAGNATDVEYVAIGTGLTGAVTMGIEDQPDADGRSATTEEGDLGFVTDAPLLGADGASLVEYGPDGDVTRYELFPSATSEAVLLGRIAVRPGSSSGDAVVAVESFSEGETSVRFARIADGEASPVGDIVVTNGQVTGLVWSPDGREIVWTTDALERSTGSDDPTRVVTTAYAARVDGDMRVTRDDSGEVPGPVVDWVWTDELDGRFQGVLVVGTPDGGAAMTEVQRFTNGQLSILESIETLFHHDMHLFEVTSEGPSVGLRLVDGQLRLGWSADGDQGGDLWLPESLADSDGSDVRMKVSGGQVLLLRGREAWQVPVVDGVGPSLVLPAAADWDVLD